MEKSLSSHLGAYNLPIWSQAVRENSHNVMATLSLTSNFIEIKHLLNEIKLRKSYKLDLSQHLTHRSQFFG